MQARILPLLSLLLAMISIQFGATVAKQLFPILGPAGTTALRTSLAAIILLVLWRPWRIARGAISAIALYGSALGFMNLLFYLALARIPLGIAVALEFLGPLALATLSSRKALDLVWVCLALIGIYCVLPLASAAAPLDKLGVFYALGAAFCWALYIIFGKRVGAFSIGGGATSLGMLTAALVVLPFGLPHLAQSSISAETWLLAIFVAIFSSAVPYSLEMFALKSLPTKTFGILMSLEPALAALMGGIFLQDQLTLTQLMAIGCIVGASAGSTLTAALDIPNPAP